MLSNDPNYIAKRIGCMLRRAGYTFDQAWDVFERHSLNRVELANKLLQNGANCPNLIRKRRGVKCELSNDPTKRCAICPM